MISVVSYSEEYKDAVKALILEIWEEEFDYAGLERPDIDDVKAYYQEDGKSNFWVAVWDGELVGTIGLKAQGGGVGYLKRMAVVEGMRKKGVGEKLLKVLLKFAGENGYKKIYAGMVPENTVAISFYKKHGFKESEFVPEGIIAVGDSVCLEVGV